MEKTVPATSSRFFDVSANIHLLGMLALTFSTGIVDAVGYLGLDKVFTANMTGNIVILGMGLVGGRAPGSDEALPVLGPILATMGFVVGAMVAGRLTKYSRPGWHRTTTWLFLSTGVGCVLIGAFAMWVHPVANTLTGYTVTVLLAICMGNQAAAARRLAVTDVTTVVVTSNITGLAADSHLGGGRGQQWPRRVFAVLLILVGAGVGATLLRGGVGFGLMTAGVFIVLVATGAHLLVQRAHRIQRSSAVR